MATEITLTNDDDPITNLNVGDYVDDGLTIFNNQTGSSTINFNNPSGITEPLRIQFGLHNKLTDFTLNLASDTTVFIDTLYTGIDRPDQITLNLGRGSLLKVADAATLPSAPLNINFSKGATFEIDRLFSTPSTLGTIAHLHGLSVGNKIVIKESVRVEYSDENLIFYNQFNNKIAHFKVEGLVDDALMFDPSTGTVTYACYLKGTHIATPSGETKVEDLRAGDKVLTASGGIAAVKWMGYRTLRKTHIPPKDAIRAYPITFVKEAIGPNLPHRDLTLSPGHHLYFDGKLVPAMLLVNGKTITQDFAREEFQYFHLELESFDILLAEGVPTESYVDTGNRWMFQNAHTVAMNPDFGPAEGRPDIPGIEVLRSGPAIDVIRERLLMRAETMTHSVRLSDPDLRIEYNDQIIHPEMTSSRDGVMCFVLPSGAPRGDARIVSRSAVVREVSTQARRDLRQVGVGLARISVYDTAGRRDIDLNDDQLLGLHPAQAAHGVTMRWTNGAAVIPAQLLNISGDAVLELHVLRTYSYWEQARHAA